MESKLGYIRALKLEQKVDRDTLLLILKAMDGYGDYRENEAKLKNLHKANVMASCQHDYKLPDTYTVPNPSPRCIKCGEVEFGNLL